MTEEHAEYWAKSKRPLPILTNIALRTCPWCEKQFTPRSDAQTYCRKECGQEHARRGYGMNKRELQMMRNRPPGPSGCSTVEQWLAAGGTIFRIEAPITVTQGMPVRGKSGDFAGGRVRR